MATKQFLDKSGRDAFYNQLYSVGIPKSDKSTNEYMLCLSPNFNGMRLLKDGIGASGVPSATGKYRLALKITADSYENKNGTSTKTASGKVSLIWVKV